MSTIITPPAESTEPVVTGEPSGTEGQEQAPLETTPTELEQPAESGEPTPEPTVESPQPAAQPEEDPFFAESTLPPAQIEKIKSVFGDDALEVVTKLEQVEEIKKALGEMPTPEAIQALGQSQQAFTQLMVDLEKNPQKAVSFFLLNEHGDLDERGGKFVSALADGVRRGTIPTEARMPLVQAAFAAARVDVARELEELKAEIDYAQAQGKEAKVHQLQVSIGEQQIISEFLDKILGIKVAPRKPVAPVEKTEKPVAPSPIAQQIQAVEQEQFKAYNATVQTELDKYISKIPASVPASLREAAIQGAKARLEQALESQQHWPRFTEMHQRAVNQAAQRVVGHEDALRRAAHGYRNLVQVAASQVFGPMLKDLGIVLNEKDKTVLDARKAGEQKLETPATAGPTTSAASPKDWDWDRSKETMDQYLDRMTKIAASRA